jgi:hypothetical protein
VKRRADPLGPVGPGPGVEVPSVEAHLSQVAKLAAELGPKPPTKTKAARFGIEKVTRFVTPDGEEHATFAGAQSHAASKELIAWVYNFLITAPRNLPPNQAAVISQELVPALKRAWVIGKRSEKQR